MNNIPPIVWVLLIGLIAGWLAHVLMGGRGGIIRNIIVGVLGAFVGGWLLPELGVSTALVSDALINTILVSTIGAVVVLFVARLLAGRG
jgi:uncharacterized membrane protein YeaQ/YmgE (transglycosylase-associated protein family)